MVRMRRRRGGLKAGRDVMVPAIVDRTYRRLVAVQGTIGMIAVLNIIGLADISGIVGSLSITASSEVVGLMLISAVLAGCTYVTLGWEKRRLRKVGAIAVSPESERKTCRECRYDLEGLPLRSIVCPECGAMNRYSASLEPQ